MTLSEISMGYEQSARLLRQRIHDLRLQIRQTDDPEELWHLQQRIRTLSPILVQMRELADLTAHYYERGYWRNAKYTL